MRTGKDGSFLFHSVPDGPLRVSGHDLKTGWSAVPLNIQVDRDEHRQNVELVLQPTRTFAGRLTAGGAVVAGARISVYPFVGETASRVQSSSDVDGRFEVNIPSASSRALVLVAAPGRSFQSSMVDMRPDTTAEIGVALHGGTLVVALPKTSQQLTIAANGVILPFQDLFEWARGTGGVVSDQEMTLPDLAPGPYRICLKAAPNQQGRDRCANAMITAGTVISADLSKP
jgi:hypothetical protein